MKIYKQTRKYLLCIVPVKVMISDKNNLRNKLKLYLIFPIMLNNKALKLQIRHTKK